MKAFFKTLAHAAIGGFLSGGLAAVGGSPALKAILLAALGSALSSAFSALAPSTVKK